MRGVVGAGRVQLRDFRLGSNLLPARPQMGTGDDRTDAGRDDSDGGDYRHVCGRQTLRPLDQTRDSRSPTQSRSRRHRLGGRLFRTGDEHARSDVAARLDGSRAILSGAACRQFLRRAAIDRSESVAWTVRRAALLHYQPRRTDDWAVSAGLPQRSSVPRWKYDRMVPCDYSRLGFRRLGGVLQSDLSTVPNALRMDAKAGGEITGSGEWGVGNGEWGFLHAPLFSE